jgi:Uma2 family endonuclease
MSQAIPTLHSWSRSEYERIVDAGGFDPESRLELLDGEIIEISAQKSAHATAVDLVEDTLRQCFSTGFYIRGQKPIALDETSEPEPDLAVVTGSIRDYVDSHPRTAVLIVEVSDTTLAFDRARKIPAYARNGINEYWILNLRDRVLEVHRDPVGESYQQRLVLAEEDSVSPLGAPDTRIAVGDMLP